MAAVVELLDGLVVELALRELFVEDVEFDAGVLVLAVLFVELYGVTVVAAEFELVEFCVLVDAAVFALFDVSVVAVVDEFGLV